MKLPRTLGRYEIVDLISEGGMGALYRARDPRIGRYVAIKQLKRGYDTRELRDRFSREAIAAGGLSHPNIVTIYDVGEDDGLPFIAMEYVRGETFADLVCLRPPLATPRKLQLTEEVCAGLAHAHEAGIVHRDIKPANLIVGPEGTVKILDFGIAKLSASGITVPGAIMGTLNYMSPEQIKGADIDARADIFAVGAVLYELLSHQQAFPGSVHDEVFQRILKGVPRPIAEHCPDIDPRLVRLIDRALEKDPSRRFQDVVSVQKELVNIRLNPVGAELRVAPPRPSSSDKQAAVMTPPPAPVPEGEARVTVDLPERRAQRMAEHLVAAEQAFDLGDYDAAIESCHQVLVLDASDIRALSLIERSHEAIGEREIQAHITAARSHLSRGATKMARQALDSAALISPSHPEIGRVRDEVAAEEASVRTRMVRAAIERAHISYEGGDPTSALENVEQALALDPLNAEAKALAIAVEIAIGAKQEELRIRAAVDDARQQFVRGEHLTALQSLEQLQPASNALVAGTLEELRVALREIEERRRIEAERAERRRRIAALLDDARASLEASRPDEAMRLLAQVRDIDATVPELSDLTGRAQQAQAAARLKAEIERAFDDLEDQLAQGELPRAGDILRRITSLAPTDSRVHEVRQRLEQAVAALAAKEAADARRREGERKLDDAATCLDAGDLSGAADMLRLASELIPQHPRGEELSARLRDAIDRKAAAEAAERLRERVAALIASASQHLQSTDDQALALGLREVDHALALDAQNADASRLKVAIHEALAARQEAARVRAVINNAHRRFANGKHQAAIRLLEDFQPSSHSEIAGTLSELRRRLLEIEEQRRAERERREKETRVAALLADARAALRDGRFDAALALLSTVGEIDPAAPELSSLQERVHQGQAAARLRAELDTLFVSLDDSLRQGDLSAARDFLSAASELDPADGRVPLARQRIEQELAAREAAEARARDLEDKLAAAGELLERGDIQGAAQLVQLVLNLNDQHPRALLLAERVERALKAQQAADADLRLRQTVDESLAAVAERLQSADHQVQDLLQAKQTIARALALVPDHAGALALEATAERALATHREAARIRAVIGNARSRFANGKHQSAIQLLEDLDPSSHPVVADVLKEFRDALRDLQERRRVEQERAEEHGMAAHEHATILVPVPAAGPHQQAVDETDTSLMNPAVQGTEDTTHGPASTDAEPDRGIRGIGAIPWSLGVVVGVGVLLLLIWAIFFRAPGRVL